jgi:hypothetical protein
MSAEDLNTIIEAFRMLRRWRDENADFGVSDEAVMIH